MLLSHLRYALPAGLALSVGAAAVATTSNATRARAEAAAAAVPSVAFKRSIHHGKPAMIVRDPDAFARKWKKFCTDGLDKLIVIADFDQTLTPQFKPNGDHASSSHGVLMSSSVMDPVVVQQEKELFKTYFPIEMSPKLSQAEKLPYMEEWWSKAHGLLVQYKLQRKQIVDAVTQGDLVFRPGFIEIFKVLAREKVPTLIFSAGLYDVIHEVLHQEFQRHEFPTTPSNVHVVSNMMQFDNKGVITGFQGSLIHCFNKNASVLLDTPFYRQCKLQKRRNILLLGDSRGDINMSKGLDVAEDEIIRVGFLNVHVEESLDDYLKLYDVVLTNDASLRSVELLIHQIQ